MEGSTHLTWNEFLHSRLGSCICKRDLRQCTQAADGDDDGVLTAESVDKCWVAILVPDDLCAFWQARLGVGTREERDVEVRWRGYECFVDVGADGSGCLDGVKRRWGGRGSSTYTNEDNVLDGHFVSCWKCRMWFLIK